MTISSMPRDIEKESTILPGKSIQLETPNISVTTHVEASILTGIVEIKRTMPPEPLINNKIKL